MISVKAYAKINLGLEILERRTDGYHLINTVFVRISLHDHLELLPDSDLMLECTALRDVPEERNLAYIAAQKLRQLHNYQGGAKIVIHKHIPSGAGLGGGSSDAASVLLGCQKLWNVTVDPVTLHSLALECGADVPFFLGDRTAVASGIGDELQYVDARFPFTVLLVCPDIHVSTAWAYANVVIPHRGSGLSMEQRLQSALATPSQLPQLFANDFENVVFDAHPELSTYKSRMYDYGAVYAQMSGSGSSVYGLFENESAALAAAARWKGLRTFVCSMVTSQHHP